MKQGTHSHGPGSENLQAVQSTVQVQVQGHTNVVQQHAYRPQQEEESSRENVYLYLDKMDKRMQIRKVTI